MLKLVAGTYVTQTDVDFWNFAVIELVSNKTYKYIADDLRVSVELNDPCKFMFNAGTTMCVYFHAVNSKRMKIDRSVIKNYFT